MSAKKNTSYLLLNKDRLEIFCDGVFAIAITLLVLEIKIPGHEEMIKAGGLYAYLLHLWPSYLAYFVSFLVIGIYWSNYHYIFTYIIKKTDHFFNLINILFLMTIAFVPFSTAIFSEFIQEKEQYAAAVTMYSIGLILPQLTLIILFFYAKYRDGISDNRLSPKYANKQLMKLLGATLCTSTALGLSFHYPTAAIVLLLLCFIMYFLPPGKPEYIEMLDNEEHK